MSTAMTEEQAHYLLIYVAIISFSFLVAAVMLIAVGVGVIKLMKQITASTAEAKGKMYPLLDRFEGIAAKTERLTASAEAILADAQPKIERITTNLAQTSDVYRSKVAEVDALITDTTTKARHQSDRVDDMISTALTRTGEISANIHHAVMTPVRQLSGILNGAKASIDTLVHNFAPKPGKLKTRKPVAFEGESVYTGLEDDYHA
jgi:uncharacterized protein YoxC